MRSWSYTRPNGFSGSASSMSDLLRSRMRKLSRAWTKSAQRVPGRKGPRHEDPLRDRRITAVPMGAELAVALLLPARRCLVACPCGRYDTVQEPVPDGSECAFKTGEGVGLFAGGGCAVA